MNGSALTTETLEAVRQMLVRTTGLLLPESRNAELERRLGALAEELGFGCAEQCAEELLAGPLEQAHQNALARHLTVGETYFFRDPRLFEALQFHILPKLIERKRQEGRRLRIWSAGCCTGEEIYSIAILLHRMLPDLPAWDMVLYGTDLNPAFLERAERAEYGLWSFRGTPPHVTAPYFQSAGKNRYRLIPPIREMVRFALYNLASPDAVAPAQMRNVDILFCRNVLMYFEHGAARKAVRRLSAFLAPDGIFIASPAEMSAELLGAFVQEKIGGALVHRKASGSKAVSSPAEAGIAVSQEYFALKFQPTSAPAHPAALDIHTRAPTMASPVVSSGGDVGRGSSPRPERAYPAPNYVEVAKGYYASGDSKAALETLGRMEGWPEAASLEALELAAQILADQGQAKEALHLADCVSARSKLRPGPYLLRALILEEQEQLEAAASNLRQALYLDDSLTVAHFRLFQLCSRLGQDLPAERHRRQAERLLQGLEAGARIPEAGDMTAGQLRTLL